MEKNSNMQPQPQYPPPPYFPAEAPRTTTTYITTQPTIIPGVVTVTTGTPVGPGPNRLSCPSCNAEIITRVEYKSTTRTHVMALLLCFFFFPCACLPYCMDSCMSAHHYCPNCGCYIGIYER